MNIRPTRSAPRLTTLAAVMTAAVLASAVPALAADGPRHPAVYLGFGLGFVDPHGRNTCTRYDLCDDARGDFGPIDPAFGVRIGGQFNAWLAAELAWTLTPFGSAGTTNDWQANLLFSPWPIDVSPHVLVGVGVYDSHSPERGYDRDLEIHYGIGARAFIADWVAFRVDVRQTIVQGADHGFGFDIGFLAGFDFLIGVGGD